MNCFRSRDRVIRIISAALEEPGHRPAGVKLHKVTEQVLRAETITTGKGLPNHPFDFYLQRRLPYTTSGFEFIVGAVPGGSEIEELDDLETAQEGIIDRPVQQGSEYRQAEFRC